MDLKAVGAELSAETHSLESESPFAVHAVSNVRIVDWNLLFRRLFE